MSFEILFLAGAVVIGNINVLGDNSVKIRRTTLDACSRETNIVCTCAIPSLQPSCQKGVCSATDHSNADAKCKANGWARGSCVNGESMVLEISSLHLLCKKYVCAASKHEVVTNFSGSKNYDVVANCSCGDDHENFIGLVTADQFARFLNEQATAIYNLQEKLQHGGMCKKN